MPPSQAIVPADEYERVECPLYDAAHHEGIPA
jgi:hypothetical protein